MIKSALGEGLMIFDKLEVGPLGVNCYLVGDEVTHVGMIIDPGAEARTILRRTEALELTISALVVTHGHFDHTGALKQLKEATKALIAVPADDVPLLRKNDPVSASFGFSYPSPPAPDRLLKDGDILETGLLSFRVLHTPGHTPGGICLLGDRVVFTGDTLFCCGIGRTDLPGGNTKKIMDSIRNKLMVLSDEIIVYPGHGPETTIGQERTNNPFLQDY